MKNIFWGFLAFAVSVTAQANLLVTPTRVDLDDKDQRSAVFSLVNKGNTLSRYNIYFENKELLPTGDYLTLDTSPTSLAQFVRYSPRRVSLEPEQGTRVRMAVRLPKGTAKGEYRSYIVFHQIPLAPKVVESDPSKESPTLSLSVQAYMRISIPVILRVGDLSSEVQVETAIDKASKTSIEVTITREGDRSSYGDIEIIEMSDGKQVATVASYKNAAVYTELTKRTFSVDLIKPLTAGTELLVLYRESTSLPQAKTIESRLVM
jgi:fimbrial chaperone protein